MKIIIIHDHDAHLIIFRLFLFFIYEMWVFENVNGFIYILFKYNKTAKYNYYYYVLTYHRDIFSLFKSL